MAILTRQQNVRRGEVSRSSIRLILQLFSEVTGPGTALKCRSSSQQLPHSSPFHSALYLLTPAVIPKRIPTLD